MKTPVSYYGGKQNLVPELLKLIPTHYQYGEPFTGGGSLFWAKPKSKHEFINDIDLRVFNFWQVMQNDFESLQAMIQKTMHHEEEHRRARVVLQEEMKDPVLFAWAFWVQTQMSFGKGIFKGFAFDNGGSSIKSADFKKEKFTSVLWERIKRTEIFNRDAIELILAKDSKETFFYLDPPYLGSDCGHYEKLTEVYYRLLEVLPTLKSKWLLSSYPDPVLQKLIEKHGFNSKQIKQPIGVSSKDNKGKTKIETLTFNYNFQGQNINLFT